MSRAEALERLLEQGPDGALLRFGLGTAYLAENDFENAVAHLARAVALDPEYTAAWKLYGKALASAGEVDKAIAAYEQGIRVAEKRKDIQAAKEMRVFIKRLRK